MCVSKYLVGFFLHSEETAIKACDALARVYGANTGVVLLDIPANGIGPAVAHPVAFTSREAEVPNVDPDFDDYRDSDYARA